MSNLFNRYIVASGLSTVGDWLKVIALNWAVVESLGGNSSHNLLRIALTGLTGLLVSFIPIRQLPTCRMLVFANIVAALQSVIIAALLSTGNLTVTLVIVLDVLHTMIASLSGPASQTLFKRISGKDQQAAAFREATAIWLARIAAGLVAIPLTFLGSSTLFIVDSVSFIPMIVLLISIDRDHRSRNGSDVAASTELRLSVGIRELASRRRHLFLVAFHSLDWIVSGLGFAVSAEILKRELNVGMVGLCLWLTATGASAWIGNRLASIYRGKYPHRSPLLFFGSTIASRVFLITVGLSGTFDTFIVMYVLFVFVSTPIMVLDSAYFRDFPDKHVASVSRANGIVNTLSSWLRLGLFAAVGLLDVSSGHSVAIVSSIVLAITFALMASAAMWCKEVYRPWQHQG